MLPLTFNLIVKYIIEDKKNNCICALLQDKRLLLCIITTGYTLVLGYSLCPQAILTQHIGFYIYKKFDFYTK